MKVGQTFTIEPMINAGITLTTFSTVVFYVFFKLPSLE